jgi:hypothetical protein
VKLTIFGTPELAVTVNGWLLVADPAGVVTEMVPVVVPTGTAVTMLVAVDDTTVAAVPLKLTALLLGVALNPVPVRVTVVPTGPCRGLKSMMEAEVDGKREIPRRFPTASYE